MDTNLSADRCVFRQPNRYCSGSHDEAIWHEGELIGRITSGNYGHALGGAIGMGYVPAALADAESFTVQVGNRMVTVCASRRPLYDPRAERVRG